MPDLNLERCSVCAADDVDAPHRMKVSVNDYRFSTIAEAIVGASYLPSISGGKATWIVRDKDIHGPVIAVIAQQWGDPKFLWRKRKQLRTNGQSATIYVQYRCQSDPDAVLHALRWGRPLPNKSSR